MLVSMGPGFASGWPCDWRMTNVKENMSSSSLLSLIRKLGAPLGFEGSGSWGGSGAANKGRGLMGGGEAGGKRRKPT